MESRYGFTLGQRLRQISSGYVGELIGFSQHYDFPLVYIRVHRKLVVQGQPIDFELVEEDSD